MPLHLPIQAVVDRTVLFSYPPLVRQPVQDHGGTVTEILANPVDGNYGSLPGDPAPFPPRVNPQVAVCHILSSYAASRCSRGGGYF